MATTTTYDAKRIFAENLELPQGIIEAEVDMSADNQGAADIVQVLSIPANTLVMEVGMYVITAESAATTPTLDVGDGTTADGWLDGIDLATANLAASSFNDASEYDGGKFYATADTIDAKLVAAGNTTGKFRVYARVLRPRML